MNCFRYYSISHIKGMHFSCYSLRSQIKTVHLQCISSVILSTARWYQCICYASLLLFFQETDEDNAFAIHFTCYSSKNQIRPMQLLCISSAILAKVTLSHKYGIFCSSSPRASQFLPRRYKKIQIRPGNRYALLLLSYKRERERERLRQKKKSITAQNRLEFLNSYSKPEEYSELFT